MRLVFFYLSYYFIFFYNYTPCNTLNKTPILFNKNKAKMAFLNTKGIEEN